MAVKVLIVDDSGFFRRRLKSIISADPRFEVVGEAVDGRDGVAKVLALRPDVVTMDVEMPNLDGIEATRKIMREHPIPILIFSSFTTAGAKVTLDALDAGAVDYLSKGGADASGTDNLHICNLLYQVSIRKRKFQSRSPTRTASPISETKSAVQAPVTSKIWRRPRGLKMVSIGSSTGGPVALQDVLTKLPCQFPYPILLIQHMPGTFTPAFAQRLNQLCQIDVKEAVDGDRLQPGVALLAPGGTQMRIEKVGAQVLVRISQNEPGHTYKPSVDVTLESVASVYAGDSLAIILTGMGADGRKGAQMLKNLGASVWSQDEASSTVYGMPAAVASFSDLILPLSEVGPKLAQV